MKAMKIGYELLMYETHYHRSNRISIYGNESRSNDYINRKGFVHTDINVEVIKKK